MKEMRIRLSDALQAEIERRVQRGEFKDASDMIAAAVRYYAERHRDSPKSSFLPSCLPRYRGIERHGGTAHLAVSVWWTPIRER